MMKNQIQDQGLSEQQTFAIEPEVLSKRVLQFPHLFYRIEKRIGVKAKKVPKI